MWHSFCDKTYLYTFFLISSRNIRNLNSKSHPFSIDSSKTPENLLKPCLVNNFFSVESNNASCSLIATNIDCWFQCIPMGTFSGWKKVGNFSTTAKWNCKFFYFSLLFWSTNKNSLVSISKALGVYVWKSHLHTKLYSIYEYNINVCIIQRWMKWFFYLALGENETNWFPCAFHLAYEIDSMLVKWPSISKLPVKLKERSVLMSTF